MIEYLRRHLGAKLFLSYIGIVVAGVVTLLIATQFALPASFNRHMAGMGAGMNSNGMMGPGTGAGRGLYANFRAGVFEATTYAALSAGLVAILISFFFSRRVIPPLRSLTTASQRIAEGHYDERVHLTGDDELAQLASRFNQMAEQLEQTESMRRQLIGDVSHELRTPLTTIKGYVEGLSDGVLPADAETLAQIQREAERLSRLVDDLQELSRVEAKNYPLDFRPVDVSALVATAVKRLLPQAEAKRIGLRSDLPADLPPLLADEYRLEQVLVILLSNAIQYTPEEGQVTIGAAHKNKTLEISVSDNGIGIAPEHLHHIFTRFYRVDASRSRGSGGSGIGLAIARHLVEAHEGTLRAESAGEGKGSTFIVTLPIK